MRVLRTKEEQHQVLITCHNEPTSGHFGITKTMERVSESFYWKGMVTDVRDMVSHNNYILPLFLCQLFILKN